MWHKGVNKLVEKKEKKVEKVITGSVKSKKKSGLQKFTDNFISDDVNSVKSYILFDVLIPSIKDAISEIVRNGIDIILYGDAGYSKSTSNASKVKYKSYDKMFDRKRERKYSSSVRAGYSYDDIVLDNRGEAEHVLMRMDELISMYDSASVADLYDLVGMTGNYTDNKYGWTDLHNADIIRIRDGYLLKLPRALPLD